MSDLSKSQIADEFGFVEIKIQEESQTSASTGKLQDLSLDELQKLCQQENGKKQINKDDDDPGSKDSVSVEKQIAVELLRGQNNNNNNDSNNSNAAENECVDYFLQQKVEQMSVDRGHAVVSSKNRFDALHSPIHHNQTQFHLSSHMDENKAEVDQSSNQDLPAWLLNLEPDVQREFLEAMKMVVGKQ